MFFIKNILVGIFALMNESFDTIFKFHITSRFVDIGDNSRKSFSNKVLHIFDDFQFFDTSLDSFSLTFAI